MLVIYDKLRFSRKNDFKLLLDYTILSSYKAFSLELFRVVDNYNDLVVIISLVIKLDLWIIRFVFCLFLYRRMHMKKHAKFLIKNNGILIAILIHRGYNFRNIHSFLTKRKINNFTMEPFLSTSCLIFLSFCHFSFCI